MDRTTPQPTARRSFLQRLSVGTLALASAGTITHAASATPAPPPVAAPRVSGNGDWLDRIKGGHRQVFDAVEPNMGFGPAYALNYLDSCRAEGLGPDDVSAVLVVRHAALPLLLDDATWSKYNIGAGLQVDDPETEAPALRNIFDGNIPLRPGLTYEQVITDHGVIVVACNLALTVLSGMMAPAASVSADEAQADWRAGLVPGVTLVSSGVFAVDLAQQHGCSYCYAG